MGTRIKIQLSPNSSKNLELPVDYQYILGCSVYNTIAHSDKNFANWLHQQGYGNDNKRFKLFTYSSLKFGKFKIIGDRIIIKELPIEFQVSTLSKEIANYFLNGIFIKQKLEIGDRKGKITFNISSIEAIPEVKFNNEMIYKLMTPCVVSKKTEKGVSYLSPEEKEEGYDKYLLSNLLNKFFAFNTFKKNEREEIFEKIFTHCNIELLTSPKSKLITIKGGTTKETRVRGFLYTFKLKAPEEIHRIGYYAGFGEKNSMGFGWGEVVELN